MREAERKTGEEKYGEDIFRERESFSLPARGMTHLLPADRRKDGGKEGRREEMDRGRGVEEERKSRV